MKRYVIGISGASGTSLSLKLIETLVDYGYHVDLIITQAALLTANYELDAKLKKPADFLEFISKDKLPLITLQANQFIGASPASGTYRSEGMVVVPCSMATLAAVSIGLGDNLLRRAADVTIKEKRPLILIPREAPFSTIHLENMLKLSQMGVIILPPVVAWYLKPQTVSEVENYLIAKVLDLLKIEHNLIEPWNPH